MLRRRIVTGVILASASTVAVWADTLVLRDGRRVQGRLVAVRDNVIEFDGQRGLFGRERLRIDRDDVSRIELDEFEDDRGASSDRGDDVRRPSGMRERSISVSASQAWTDTGVNIRAGQTVYFESSGRVRWGPGRQDGPEGERNSPRNDGRPIGSRPAGALIGRVGEGEGVFFIGDETGPIRVRDSGRLFLGINDDFLQDNSGSFRVTVYY